MYLYKCDKPECGKKFKSQNPESCPKCNSEEFSISNKKSNSSSIKYGLLILLIGAGIFLFQKYNQPNINSNDITVNESNEIKENKISTQKKLTDNEIKEVKKTDLFQENIKQTSTKTTPKKTVKKQKTKNEKILTEDEYWQRGNKYLDEEKYNLAINDFTHAINLSDFIYYDYHYNRGEAYFFTDQYKLALDDYNKALKINETSKVLYSIAYVHGSLGDYNEAIIGFSECIKKDPYHDWAYYDRGRIKYINGEYRSAINDLNIFIKVKADFFYAYYYRGLSYSFLGDKNNRTEAGYYRDALENYKTAIELNPNPNNDIFLYIGEAYLVQEKYHKALENLNYYINNVDEGKEDAYAYFLRALVKDELRKDPCSDLNKCCELGDLDCCNELIDYNCN
jgi:tetratricopeptide (TPR) repeat protein